MRVPRGTTVPAGKAAWNAGHVTLRCSQQRLTKASCLFNLRTLRHESRCTRDKGKALLGSSEHPWGQTYERLDRHILVAQSTQDLSARGWGVLVSPVCRRVVGLQRQPRAVQLDQQGAQFSAALGDPIVGSLREAGGRGSRYESGRDEFPEPLGQHLVTEPWKRFGQLSV